MLMWGKTKERLLINLVVPFIAVVLSFVAGALFIAIIGGNPFIAYRHLFSECFASGYGFGQVLQKTTQLIFVGLAVAIGFRAGLFNIGAEGQLYVGAFAVALAGYFLAGIPPIITILMCILAGLIAGGFWAFIPGLLRALFGAHEVITTIMMNFIAFAFINFLITIPCITIEDTVITRHISPAAHLPRLDTIFPAFKGSTVNFSFLLALITIAVTWYLLWRTPLGYEIRAVGLNPRAAKTAGINIKKIITTTMLISGGLAGLVGADFVLGYKHYFEEGFSGGIGFLGIAVALLGLNHPVGVLFAAFLFGVLSYGKIALTGIAPKEIVEILQALIIILVVVSAQIARRYLRRLGKKGLLQKSP